MNKPEPVTLPAGVVTPVPLDLIDADEHQARTEFDEAFIAELAEDIKRRGVRNPIELRPAGERFIIETGEQRVREARAAGLDTIPALLAGEHEGESEGLERLVHQALENTLRNELTIIDKAHLFVRLRDEHGIKVGDLPEFLEARGLGKYSRPYVSNIIRMLELPDWAKDAISIGQMPASAAKPILSVSAFPEVLDLMRESLEAHDFEYDGTLHEHDVELWAVTCMEEVCLRVDQGWNKSAPYYDVDEHAEAVGLTTLTVDGHDYLFITNKEAHQRLQDEHPKPHPKSRAAQYPRVHGEPDKVAATVKKGKAKKAAGDEPKPKTSLLEIRNVMNIETYLVDWWRDYLLLHLPDASVIDAVLHWAAAGCPHEDEWQKSRSAEGQEIARKAFKRHRLGAFLAEDLNDDERMKLFECLLEHMGPIAIADLVTFLGHTLEDCYRIDETYLGFHTKATLAHWVEKSGVAMVQPRPGVKKELDPEWKACAKLGEMRSYCLKRAEKFDAPADLVKVWADLCKRVKV